MTDAPSLFDAELRPSSEAVAPPDDTGGRPRTVAERRPAADLAAPALLAVDGDGLAHRAFHAPPSSGTGGPMHGFLALLVGLCERAPADAVVVGFDCRERSVRRERYPAYKGHRGDKDDALVALLLALPEALADLGLSVRVVEGWEADDVVASAATAAEGAGWRCTVASADRDAWCLVSDRTTVLRPRDRGAAPVAVTPQRLRAEAGVAPEQYLDYAALRGDASDNLPGVPGIGPARASALLRAYPSVDAAATDPLGCRSVLGPRVGQALLDDLADPDASVFRRNVALMRPRRDLEVDLAAAAARPAPERIGERLAAWGLGSLTRRLVTALADRPELAPLPAAPEA